MSTPASRRVKTLRKDIDFIEGLYGDLIRDNLDLFSSIDYDELVTSLSTEIRWNSGNKHIDFPEILIADELFEKGYLAALQISQDLGYTSQ